MDTRIKHDHTLEPQLSTNDIDTNKLRSTIGMLASENWFAPVMLSLKHIETFVDEHNAVFIQRGIGIEHEIPDYLFTEYGADIMEDELPVIALSNIVLKYDFFTIEEIFFLKEKQIIISNAPPDQFSNEIVQYLHEKKITAVGTNFLSIENSNFQNIINQIVSLLISSKRIIYDIQLNPLLLKGIYCYNGEICNRAIAANAGVPWKDLVELCWNWN